ncbi:MAG: hypothetical protein E7166_00110 [Firmicutes bacterium]|nr:hypothetical protein [Bacillota bacterium]
MDINYLLKNSSDFSRFDEINNNNLEHLDIGSLFKLEENIIKNICKLENKNKDLDIIYLKYQDLKNSLKEKIISEKKLLIKINSQKEEYDKSEEKRKLLYLTKEYNFLLEQTNTKTLMSRIKEIDKKVELLRKELKDRKITMQYNKIKSKYSKIIIFINSEKFDNKTDVIPNNINMEEKIIWYENRIEEIIEKKMIFDNYIFSLETLYKDIVEKRMLDITNK